MFVLEVMLHRQVVYLLLVVTWGLVTLPLLYPTPILVLFKIGDEIIAYENINTGSPDWVVDIVGHNGSVSGRNWDPVTNSGAATGTGSSNQCYSRML